jgi:dual oxidase
MFDLMDQDRNGFISFRDFRDLLILFREGTADEKLKWLFDMYDTDGSGRLMIKEFRLMITYVALFPTCSLLNVIKPF